MWIKGQRDVRPIHLYYQCDTAVDLFTSSARINKKQHGCNTPLHWNRFHCYQPPSTATKSMWTYGQHGSHLYCQCNTVVHSYTHSFLSVDKKGSCLQHPLYSSGFHYYQSSSTTTNSIRVNVWHGMWPLHLYYQCNMAVHQYYATSFPMADKQEVVYIIGYGVGWSWLLSIIFWVLFGSRFWVLFARY